MFCQSALGQKVERYEPEDNQEQQEYDKEFTYGPNWNTRAGLIGGVNFKYAFQHRQRQLEYHVIGLEFAHVKHPKEVSVFANAFGSSFIYGKKNYMFTIRPHYGREFILFRKAEEEGIQVSAIFAAGPSLTYLKPYYIEYIVDSVTLQTRPYTEDIEDSRIYGGGSFFRGFGSMTAHLGAHTKTSINFEYGRFGSSVAGIEAGLILEAYTERLILIPRARNNWFFNTLFFSIYFGFR